MVASQGSTSLWTAGGRKDPSETWQETTNPIKDLAKCVIVYVCFIISADLRAIYSFIRLKKYFVMVNSTASIDMQQLCLLFINLCVFVCPGCILNISTDE